MNPNGRPTLLVEQITVKEWSKELEAEVEVTKTIGEAIIDLLTKGHNARDACDLIGVDLKTYYNWRNAGMDAAAKLAEGYELTNNEDLYLHFFQASQRARRALKDKLIGRLVDLIPSMEAREVTDVLARIDKVEWSKASSMKLDVTGEIGVVEQHGRAVATMIRMVVQGMVAAAPSEAAKARLRDAAPGVVQDALAAVVAPGDTKQIEAGDRSTGS